MDTLGYFCWFDRTATEIIHSNLSGGLSGGGPVAFWEDEFVSTFPLGMSFAGNF